MMIVRALVLLIITLFLSLAHGAKYTEVTAEGGGKAAEKNNLGLCPAQAKCIEFTISKTNGESGCSLQDGCGIEVCMILDTTKESCDKVGPISHLCAASDSRGCAVYDAADGVTPLTGKGGSAYCDLTGRENSKAFDGKCEPSDHQTRIVMCQEAMPGQTVHWALKDSEILDTGVYDYTSNFTYALEDGSSCKSPLIQCRGDTTLQCADPSNDMYASTRVWSYQIPENDGSECDLCDNGAPQGSFEDLDLSGGGSGADTSSGADVAASSGTEDAADTLSDEDSGSNIPDGSTSEGEFTSDTTETGADEPLKDDLATSDGMDGTSDTVRGGTSDTLDDAGVGSYVSDVSPSDVAQGDIPSDTAETDAMNDNAMFDGMGDVADTLSDADSDSNGPDASTSDGAHADSTSDTTEADVAVDDTLSDSDTGSDVSTSEAAQEDSYSDPSETADAADDSHGSDGMGNTSDKLSDAASGSNAGDGSTSDVAPGETTADATDAVDETKAVDDISDATNNAADALDDEDAGSNVDEGSNSDVAQGDAIDAATDQADETKTDDISDATNDAAETLEDADTGNVASEGSTSDGTEGESTSDTADETKADDLSDTTNDADYDSTPDGAAEETTSNADDTSDELLLDASAPAGMNDGSDTPSDVENGTDVSDGSTSDGGKDDTTSDTSDASTSLTSGSKGDPHFKSWVGEHFEYHGQCDLVLAHDDDFADGLGIDVQIRTKLVRYWSYITRAAVRIGDDILEVGGAVDTIDDSPLYWYNFDHQGETYSIGGFPLALFDDQVPGHPKRSYEIDLSSRYPGHKISIATFKEFVRVDFINASEEAFGNTVGMMGDFKTGKTLGRDGLTEFDDFTEYGAEWQVRPSDNMLFHDVSDPQFPQRCVLPEDPRGQRRRRLAESSVSVEAAEKACARLTDELDRKECVYDIIATQDLDMVGAY